MVDIQDLPVSLSSNRQRLVDGANMFMAMHKIAYEKIEEYQHKIAALNRPLYENEELYNIVKWQTEQKKAHCFVCLYTTYIAQLDAAHAFQKTA